MKFQDIQTVCEGEFSVDEYKFHPTSSIFPLLEKGSIRFTELVESIRNNGLLDPITLNDGMILDGRNRYLACKEAEIEPRFEEPEIRGFLADFVQARGIRRDLTLKERQIAAGRYAVAISEEAKARGRAKLLIGMDLPSGSIDPDGETGRSREIAAKKFGVSASSVKRVITVLQRAPELIKAIEDGSVALHSAAEQASANGSASVPKKTPSRQRRKQEETISDNITLGIEETPQDETERTFLFLTNDAIEFCTLTMTELDTDVIQSESVIRKLRSSLRKAMKSWKQLSDKLDEKLEAIRKGR